MNYRSHTRESLAEARACGETAYALDTGNDGLDDVLTGLTAGEVWQDVAHWLLEAGDDEIPPHWMLDPLDWPAALDGAEVTGKECRRRL